MTPSDKNMAPPKWATAEEEKFFHSHYARYQIWEPVFEEWFASFPEWLRTYKDIPLDVELTVKQKIEVANTVEACASTTAAMTMMAGESMDSMLGVPGKSVVAQMHSTARDRPVCSLQMSEAFSKLFFEKSKGWPKAAAENIDIKMPHKIGVIRRQTELLYSLAPDEIKQQVAEFVKEIKKKKQQEFEETKEAMVIDHQTTPETHWICFTVLMGGLTPAMVVAAAKGGASMWGTSSRQQTLEPESSLLADSMPHDISTAETIGHDDPTIVIPLLQHTTSAEETPINSLANLMVFSTGHSSDSQNTNPIPQTDHDVGSENIGPKNWRGSGRSSAYRKVLPGAP
ncbi:hypothetical protein EV424DRAFT_1349305 [Suillus variegatus]|nr:hypothetical protein EV424DRAFT_1349305 [Suillus variegatus]